jgi:hypothetical protein
MLLKINVYLTLMYMFLEIANISHQHYETPFLTVVERPEICGWTNVLNFAL